MAVPQVAPARNSRRPKNLDVADALLEVGNRLVMDFGFENADLVGSTHVNRTTEPLVRFLIWLKQTPEANALLRQVLAERVAALPAR